MDADETPLPPEQMAALIRDQRAATIEATSTSTTTLMLAWGLAWVVGYGSVWLSARGTFFGLPPKSGLVVLAAALAIAGGVSAVAIARTSRGVRGAASWQGTVYGIGWALAFTFMGTFGGVLQKLGMPEDATNLYFSIMPTAIVALMYIVGSAIWMDRAMFGVGIAILVAGFVAMWFGPVNCNGVMALLGGGSLLIGALISALGTRRVRGAAL